MMKRTTPTPRKAAAPELLYRFEVKDPQTGHPYIVLVGEDGMAYREEVVQPALRAVG